MPKIKSTGLTALLRSSSPKPMAHCQFDDSASHFILQPVATIAENRLPLRIIGWWRADTNARRYYQASVSTTESGFAATASPG